MANRLTSSPATLLRDAYKLFHRYAYVPGTTRVFSTWTPRTSRIPGVEHVLNFGQQRFITEWLIEYFNDDFFSRPVEDVVTEYLRIVSNAFGQTEDDGQHIRDLHALGYLPLEIKSLPEGALVPLRVPTLTIENTHDDFAWLTNAVETLMSCELWQPTTAATQSFQYRKILEKYAKLSGDPDFVKFQGHDFSMRGMGGVHLSELTGAGHLLSFRGTDTIPAIPALERFYGADCTKELVGTSIDATEHSVMCLGMTAFMKEGDTLLDGERKFYEWLMFELRPTGFLSLVSDTMSLWDVIHHILAPNKDRIMARDGRIVVRPDSGDPVKIICGDPDAPDGSDERKGVITLLDEIFGHTVNEKGYKILHPSIGCIYGDAITLDRCEEICKRLTDAGWSSSNIVLGIGSYTFAYVTRDTFGWALKSTWAEYDGHGIDLYKDPVTDNGVKKSAKGRVAVLATGDAYELIEISKETAGFDWTKHDALKPIFRDGKLLVTTTLAEIRERVDVHIEQYLKTALKE